MILHVPSLFDANLTTRAKFSGPLIEHLIERYPTGWGDGYGRVFVNRAEIIVDNYDMHVSDSDEVIILTGQPHDPLTIAFFIGTYAVTWGTVVQVGLMLLSMILVVVLTPKIGEKGGRGAGKVYSISGAQNQPALGEVIAEHFGRVWFYPDVASQPYSQFINNNQYLYQILLLGAGEFDIEGITFGNTQYDLLPPGLVEYRVFAPQDHKRQYGVIQSEFNVYEDVVTSEDVQGLDFSRNGEDSWAGQATGVNALKGTEYPTSFAVGDVVTLLGQPGWAMHRLTKTITIINGLFIGFANTVADDHWYQVVKVAGGDDGWRGWFNTLPVGKTTDRLEFDFDFPRGLSYVDNEGRVKNWTCRLDVEIQGIDENNQDTGPLITQQFTYTRATRDPLRITQSLAVTQGRYKVRCRRQDADDVNGHTQSQVGWSALKAYCVNTMGQYVYGDVTLIAIKMKASAALSSTADRISILATRKLLTVASDLTVLAPTVNPVDSFTYIVRESDPDGADLVPLKALGARWANTNGFNYRFEKQTTVYSALQLLAAGHRSTPEGYAKKLSMRQDVAKPIDQYIVSQENMIVDSYSCGVRLGNEYGLIDGLKLAYRDPTGVRELYVVVPSGAISPEALTLDGCTDKATAVAMGNFLWQKRIALRRTVEFQTEWDANVFSIGDRISVLQNLIDTVRTARVIAVNGNDLVIDAITVDPISVIVRMRNQYGEPSELIPASLTGNVLSMSILPFPVFGADSGQDQTTVMIGSTSSFSRSFIVDTISPSADNVSVTCSSYSALPYSFPIPGELL